MHQNVQNIAVQIITGSRKIPSHNAGPHLSTLPYSSTNIKQISSIIILIQFEHHFITS